MIAPSSPDNEQTRLSALHKLELLDTQADEGFDRLTELATRIFDVPMSMITLVDEDRQWFKSRQGLSVCETPRRISFCGHVVADGVPLVIHNALKDARFADNPLVLGSPFIRFYAGYPLFVESGACIGTLCLIGTLPRAFDEGDMDRLRLMAALAEELVSLHVLRVQTARGGT
ncbi:GAF domain-containing protein [Salinicola sp. DM10]|uniref:GAF domain-containing protein n=1 Tax=Salinicola sp. DM10 TaxID=2815721 RepID=UPI001A8FF8E5|nr:GAF domain-containing protein [Salinicola sp. DM10]MCE3025426.1 GAF domain-containing protein [Salinicola sp. DM10]